jgi:hypothetical protein
MLLVSGSVTVRAASGVDGASNPTVKNQGRTKTSKNKKLRPRQTKAPPQQQPQAAIQQTKAATPQQTTAAPEAKSLGSGDALPVASSGARGPALGAFMGMGKTGSTAMPPRAVVGAAVPGLEGAVWADRDNDGVVDGYVYKGQYYQGAPR